MSFIQEEYITSYQSNTVTNASSLPYHYLPSFTHIVTNVDGKHVFQTAQVKDVNNIKPSPIHIEVPWYQPGNSENQTLLDANNIQTNQQYRNYMIRNSLSIRDYNNKMK